MFNVGRAIQGALSGGFGSGQVTEYKGSGSFINNAAGREAIMKQAAERVADSETNMVANNMTTDAQEKEMNTEHNNRQRLTNTSRQHSHQRVVGDKLAQNAGQQLA